MTSYHEALDIVLQTIPVMEIQKQSILKCVGQVLAEDIHSAYSLPQADSSIPDGYAVRAEDIKEAAPANPVPLRIIETVRAGHLPKHFLEPGTAIRIMTGAVLPNGADCVVRFEDTDEPSDKNGPNPNAPSQVKIHLAARPGANVRKAGSIIVQGSLIFSKGQVLGPAQISILISIGKTSIKVYRKPVIAVISTGDELVRAGKPLNVGKTYDCNSPAVGALITHYGGICRPLGTARDDEASILSRIRKGMNFDAIIISGGVSKGDFDLVRLILEKTGEIKFSRINMGPGAAFTFGVLKKTSAGTVPVFALSGPPTGCLINFETLVRSALLKMLGHTLLQHPFIEAIARDSFLEKRAIDFVKWTIVKKENETYHVKLNNGSPSGALIEMAVANSLAIIPEGTVVQAGDRIRVLPLDWRRDTEIDLGR